MSRNKNEKKKRPSLSIEQLSQRIMLDAAGLIEPVFYGPTPYLSEADTPGGFLPIPDCPDCVHEIETFEDGTLDHEILLSDGQIVGPDFSTGIENLTDSVDGDDGTIDGTGSTDEGGFAYFTFDDSITVTLPGLMQSAGLVWTDGDPILTNVVFEAFDENGDSLGTINAGDIADDEFTGQTAEDRFFGVSYGDGITTGITMMTITNIQEGSGIEIDHIQFANCSACCEIDLELEKTVDISTAEAGDTLKWTIEITNNEDAAMEATGVRIEDLLPENVTLVGVAVTDGSYSTSTGIWSLASDLEPGATETLTLTTEIDDDVAPGTMILNVAQVIAANENDFDSTPNNDDGDQSEDDESSAKVTIIERVIDLEVTKRVDATFVDAGDILTWTIDVENNQENASVDATGVTLSDLLPAGVSFESASATDGSFDASSGAWTLASALSPGQVETLTILTKVNPGLAGGTVLSNVTQVATQNEGDVDSTPNNDDGDQSEDDEARASVTVREIIDLELDKSVGVQQSSSETTFSDSVEVATDDLIAWQVTVTNNEDVANASATGVQIGDVLPEGLSFLDASGDGSYDSDTGTWTSSSALAPGESATFVIITEVADDLAGGTTIENTAQVIAADQDELDSTPNNDDGDQSEDDEDRAEITIESIIDLQVFKQVGMLVVDGNSNSVTFHESIVAKPGDTVVWGVSLFNHPTNANAAATGVQIQDIIPDGVTFVRADGDGSYDPETGIWTQGSSLALSEPNTFMIYTTVDEGLADGTMIQNIAQVTAADQRDFDSTPNNDDGDQSEDDEDIAKVTIQNVIDLEVTKSVDQAIVAPGDEVTFTIDVTNNPANATGAATGVQLSDVLPSGLTLTGNFITEGTFDPLSLTWTLVDSLAPGETESLILTAVASNDLIDGTIIANVAQVSAADQIDIDSTPNNDDGDQSEDDEDSASFIIGTPALLSLSGHSYVDTNNDGIFQNYELPLLGVEITLSGIDELGNEINRSTFTNAGGFYNFDELNAGSYTVTQTQPVQFVDGKDTVGNLGGSTPANDQLRVELTDVGTDYNFGELGLRPEFVNKRLYLTSTPYTSWEYVDVRQASIWYSFDNAHRAFLKIHGQVSDGDADYTVFDSNMEEIAAGDVESQDSIVIQPGEFSIRFDGNTIIDELEIEVVEPNLRVVGNSVIAVASAGNDNVELQLGDTTHTLDLAGMVYSFDAQEIDTFHLGGSTGTDHVVVHGTSADDNGSVIGMRGDLASSEYEVHTYSFENTTFHGGGGNDRVQLYGSLGADQFESFPDASTLTTPSHTLHVVDFDRVDAYGRAGSDRAFLYGSQSDDLFISKDAYTLLKSPDHLARTKGFERVDAYGRGGDDTAELHGSTGNDRLISTSSYVSMVTTNRSSVAKGFERVEAEAYEGGDDTAYLLHLTSIDSFFAANSLASLDREDRDDEVIGFDEVVVKANEGETPQGQIEANIAFVLAGNTNWV